MKKYLVTNNGEGSICVVGRNRIEIPGLCKDMQLDLPDKTARQTVSRLRQRYPLLKFTEVKTSQAATPVPQSANGGNQNANNKQPEADTVENGKQPDTANKTGENDADKTDTANGKQENTQGATGQGHTAAGKKNK